VLGDVRMDGRERKTPGVKLRGKLTLEKETPEYPTYAPSSRINYDDARPVSWLPSSIRTQKSAGPSPPNSPSASSSSPIPPPPFLSSPQHSSNTDSPLCRTRVSRPRHVGNGRIRRGRVWTGWRGKGGSLGT